MPLHACTSATCALGPSVCLHGELVMNGSPYRALLAVQGYMDRFTYLLWVVTIRHAIVPIVREALKLMRLCFSVLVFPPSSFRYSAHLFFGVGNFCQLTFEVLAQHAIWPSTVATTVNRGRCWDIV